MKLGSFVVDKRGNIISIDATALKYSTRQTGNIRWYCEGKLKINDIVINIGIDEAINISIYKNKDSEMIPFSKAFCVSDEMQDEDLLDIIYSEEHINITLSNNILKVMVNDQICLYNISETKEIVVICDDEGIEFFSTSNISHETLEGILKGEKYDAFMSYEGLLKLQEVYDNDIAECVLKCIETDKSEVQFIKNNGSLIALQRMGDYISKNQNITFLIGAEEDYLEAVKENINIYDNLYFNREIKVSKNQLGYDARLQGYDKSVKEINEKIGKVCKKNVTIVLTGESGTGKTRLAKMIHKNSRRADGTFINVNCAAISYNLIESELFGYEEGAFTGAKKGGKKGYFELAKGGTLFLDEISEVPYKLQGKLLEVLQEGTFYRVGGTEKIVADVRLIVATNRNLEKMVKENKFREDLYYRINVFPIHLPPLRERLNDLYSIIEDILPLICTRLEIEPLMVTNDALSKMKQYDWPGNIRELENVLEKAAVMADENFIRERDIVLENFVARHLENRTLKEKMCEYEKELVSQAYEMFSGDRKLMAEYLDISKTNLFDKIHKYNIEEQRFKGEF